MDLIQEKLIDGDYAIKSFRREGNVDNVSAIDRKSLVDFADLYRQVPLNDWRILSCRAETFLWIINNPMNGKGAVVLP